MEIPLSLALTLLAAYLVGRSEAMALTAEAPPSPSRTSDFALVPTLTPVRLSDGSYSASLGLAGEF